MIKEGSGVNKISQDLSNAGLVRSKLVFEFFIWAKGLETNIQAGEHRLNKGLSIKELTSKLVSGSSLSNERVITLIEGWTLRDIGEYLEKEGISRAEDFYKSAEADLSGEYDFLSSKPTGVGLEGYVFPDTYRIYKNSSAEEVIKKALNNLGQKLTTELQGQIKNQGKTVHEIMTLASIIEKEVKSDADKKMVAYLFGRRLKIGMPLQSDATVNYITHKNTERPTYDDINIASPYNTYRYRGLPPGPICNPGLAAIEAAINPTPNDYWYFLTTPDDKVIYSVTYEEHLANKSRYLK